MFGVVLWSDQKDRKAVFWCEDHGDLAYYEAPDSCFNSSDFFDAGDMVQFDVDVHQRLRKAFNPVVVQEQACSGLPETLKRTANLTPAALNTHPQTTSAKIIAFNVKDADAPTPLVALKA